MTLRERIKNRAKHSDEQIEHYRQLAGEPDLLEQLACAITPTIENHIEMRRALLLALVSLDDNNMDNNRIHVLIQGPPGTAKSRALRIIADTFGYPHLSHRTTDVGLTGTIGRPGILARHDLVAIDELDKIPKTDRDGLLEAMSDGRVSITVGGKHEQYPAPVRVIAGCNRLEDFKEETLDRFDFIIRADRPDRASAKKIMQGKITDDIGSKTVPEDAIRYISYCKIFVPTYTDRDAVLKKIDAHIDTLEPPVNMRKIDRIVKIAFAIARLRLRDVLPEDIDLAITLTSVSRP